MPIFTAIAAAVSAAVGGGLFGAVAGFAARTLLTIGITKLISNRSNTTASGTADAGSRVQLPPATNNKVPVVYGTAYMAPIITDAKISEDQKTMWYVCTLAEVTDTGGYTFGDIYWGGKRVIFDGADTARVLQLETNSDPVQQDPKVEGKIYIYKFPNGSSSGISTGGADAITLLSDASIPADLRWNSALYTSGGQSASMTDTAFIVVKVIYDTNAGTTNLATMSVELTNSLTKPGEVLYDYMTNNRYGCAILPANIDTASLTVLDTYSDELITYVPVGGGSATQARYRINGPVNTGQNCLSNLQQLVDACDSWLQYSELTGDWTIVINKPYDWDGTVITDLFLIDDSVLISGINVNPIDLNSSYNILEVQYPNTNINDQTDYNIINLIDYVPEVMSYNEPPNQLTVQFPQVNDYIQSTYLGIRRLLQSREDLTIDCTLDYSGIQIQAGDVIRVKFDYYGWDTPTFPDGKLFRVSQVQEAKLDDGSLGARITAFEYNGTVYYDDPINDFVPERNTGLTDPNFIGTPIAPTVALQTAGTINSMFVTGTVPSTGQVIYMDFNVGNNSNSATHNYYATVSASNGLPYAAGATVSINSTDLVANTYYWSMTAKNQMVGVRGPSSTSTVWTGPSVSTWDGSNGGITNNNIANSTITSSKLANSGVTAGSYTSADITVNSQGLITLAANGGGGGSFTIPNGSSPMLIIGPADDGETSVVNYLHNTTYALPDISLGIGSGVGRGYLNGTAVTSSYYLPFASGTSDTANLFIANSTAGYGSPSLDQIAGATPPLAAIQGPLYPNYSGSPPNLGGWALLKEVQVDSNYTPAANAYVRCECIFQVWANADTKLIYGGSYALSRGSVNNHYITQDKVGGETLLQYLPKQISYTFSYRGGYPSSNPVLSMGLWMKNVVSGTRVHFLQTSMIITTPYSYGDYIDGLPYAPYA